MELDVRPWEWDWSAIAAIVAALAAVVAAYFSYAASRTRAKIDVAIELNNLRKKDLRKVKEVMTEILSELYQEGGMQIVDKESLQPKVSQALLLIDPANSCAEALSNNLFDLVKIKKFDGEKVGIVLQPGGSQYEKLLTQAQKYFSAERLLIAENLEVR